MQGEPEKQSWLNSDSRLTNEKGSEHGIAIFMVVFRSFT